MKIIARINRSDKVPYPGFRLLDELRMGTDCEAQLINNDNHIVVESSELFPFTVIKHWMEQQPCLTEIKPLNQRLD